MTVRIPEELADAAETIARVHGTSINQLIIESLRSEMERVKTDGYFQTRARELLERDARIVEQLAPSNKPLSTGVGERRAEPASDRALTKDDRRDSDPGGR